MHDESQYWIAFWKIIAATVIGVTALMSGCTAHQNAMKRDMLRALLERGADPVQAVCTLVKESGAICLQDSTLIINGVRR